jgi:hypothetical protein
MVAWKGEGYEEWTAVEALLKDMRQVIGKTADVGKVVSRLA